jgi:hypothetical protein
MRKPISTRLHGVLDYTTGALLIAAPSLLGIDRKSREGVALQAAGAGHLGYSLVTDYELSLRRAVPMPAHLAVDAIGAIGLAAAPWLLGTASKSKRSWLPHVLLGAYELSAVALSRSEPGDREETDASDFRAERDPDTGAEPAPVGPHPDPEPAPEPEEKPGADADDSGKGDSGKNKKDETPEASSTPDKPAGTELHPPNTNPSRHGPNGGGNTPLKKEKGQTPDTGPIHPAGSPGERGLTAPKK